MSWPSLGLICPVSSNKSRAELRFAAFKIWSVFDSWKQEFEACGSFKSHAVQALAFKLPLAAMRRLHYINDPYASNLFVNRSSNDHILKAVKGVKCPFSQSKLKRSTTYSARTRKNTSLWASAGRGFRRSSCLLYSSPLHFFFNRRPKINLQKRKKKNALHNLKWQKITTYESISTYSKLY